MSNLTARRAIPEDAAMISAIGEIAMEESSRYRDFQYNPIKAMNSIISRIESDLDLVLAINDNEHDQVVGMFIAHEYTLFYSDTKCATDDIFYIMPSSRGSKIAKDVLKEYENWCKERGAEYAHLGVTIGIDDDSVLGLYEGLGYERIGTFLRMGMQ